jgi:hypothetical protein
MQAQLVLLVHGVNLSLNETNACTTFMVYAGGNIVHEPVSYSNQKNGPTGTMPCWNLDPFLALLTNAYP